MRISNTQPFMLSQVLDCGALPELLSGGGVQTTEEEFELQLLEKMISDFEFCGDFVTWWVLDENGKFPWKEEFFHT